MTFCSAAPHRDVVELPALSAGFEVEGRVEVRAFAGLREASCRLRFRITILSLLRAFRTEHVHTNEESVWMGEGESMRMVDMSRKTRSRFTDLGSTMIPKRPRGVILLTYCSSTAALPREQHMCPVPSMDLLR